MSHFHLKSKPTMTLVTMPNWQVEIQVSNFQLAVFQQKNPPKIGMCWVSSFFYIVQVGSSVWIFPDFWFILSPRFLKSKIAIRVGFCPDPSISAHRST